MKRVRKNKERETKEKSAVSDKKEKSSVKITDKIDIVKTEQNIIRLLYEFKTDEKDKKNVLRITLKTGRKQQIK